MPNFDKTGPAGAGPLSGRGDGPCASQQGRPSLCRRGNCGGGMGFFNRMRQGFCSQEISLDEQEKILEEKLAAVQEAKKTIEKKD